MKMFSNWLANIYLNNLSNSSMADTNCMNQNVYWKTDTEELLREKVSDGRIDR